MATEGDVIVTPSITNVAEGVALAGTLVLANMPLGFGAGVDEAGTGQKSTSTCPPLIVQVLQFLGGIQLVNAHVGEGEAKPVYCEIVERTVVE